MESLEDSRWHQIAAVRLRLRGHVRVQRRVSHGRHTFVLCDDIHRRFHRLDACAWEFVGRLDGRLSVEEAWQLVHARLGEAAPSQTEALQMLVQLASAELISQHPLLDPVQEVGRRRRHERQVAAAAVNPLSFRVPLFDPTHLLQACLPLARRLFTPSAALLWAMLLIWAATIAAGRWEELLHALRAQGRTAGFVFYAWLAYPLVKTLHEACHAMAVKAWGGDVREVGVSLMLLSPLPYVDASAASGFPSRSRRVMVSAVGVMAELAVASAALLLWSVSSNPSLQQACLAVAASCGISTLVFNANPLVRFDGYHVMCDLLDMPNMAQRARAVTAYAAARCLGAVSTSRPEASTRQAWALGAYGVLSWLYQLAVVAGVSWWLSVPYPALAFAVGLLGAASLLLPPLLRSLPFLLFDRRLEGRRLSALCRAVSIGLALVLGVWVVPAPSFTVQQGVVWPPPEAIVRAETDGDLLALAAHDHEVVDKGQVIAHLENLALQGERETTASRLQQLEVQYYDALASKSGDSRRFALEREEARAALARVDERLAGLTVKANASGTLLVPRNEGQEGHVYRRGRELAYILPRGPGVLVKVALSESQAALVREKTQTVSVVLPDGRTHVVPATLQRETPEVTRNLPSAVLGSAAGGPILIDPTDSDGRRALASVAIVDVWVPGEPARWIGARAWVRFDHGGEPLGWQWARTLRQAFLSRLALS